MTEGIGLLPGTVCWADVSTSDPAASRDFYAGLFGWTYRIDADPASGHYTYALLDDRPVAGLAGTPAQQGQPVVWTVYLTSADVERTADLVARRGGRVLYGPEEVPDQGRMCVATDPSGATIGFWAPVPGWEFVVQEPGSLCWAELTTREGALADDFFAEQFGYRQDQVGDGVSVDYTVWSLGGTALLGRRRLGADVSPDVAPHWTAHFAVDPGTGTDGAVDRVVALGGRVVTEPTDSGFGRVAAVRDPVGAAFALIDPTRRTAAVEVSAENDDPYDD